MLHVILPPLLGLLSFLVINVGGFLVMASGHPKGTAKKSLRGGKASSTDECVEMPKLPTFHRGMGSRA